MPAHSILVRQEDRDHGLTLITRTDDQFQGRQFRFRRPTVARYSVELVQQSIAGTRLGANGVGGHEEHIPQAAGLILVDLPVAVVLRPGHTVGPGGGRHGHRPREAGPFGHGARVDQHPVRNGLGAGVGGTDLAEERPASGVTSACAALVTIDSGRSPAMTAHGRVRLFTW